MRALFFGTPQLAASHLTALADRHEVAGVITKPDKPQGRGLKVSSSPVKIEAERLGLHAILTPSNLNDPLLNEKLRQLNSDIGITVAYGKILPQEIINASRLGFINVHFSLLPKLRGPSPVEFAILEDYEQTGCTTFWMDAACDTGDVILQKSTQILPGETAPEIYQRLTPLSISLLLETLEKIAHSAAPRIPQDHAQATYSKILRKKDGELDLNDEATTLERKIRAFRDWPRATLTLFGKKIQVLKATAIKEDASVEKIRFEKGRGFVLKCKLGAILIEEIQTAGGKPMSAWAFIQGIRLPHNP